VVGQGVGGGARAKGCEAGEGQEPLALVPPVTLEIRAAVRPRRRDEVLVGKTQAVELGAGNLLVIDEVAGAGVFKVDSGRRRAGKFRNRIEVDVERIEKNSTVRRIGARLLRAIREKRMQGVEPDGSRTTRCRQRNEPGKI